MTHRITRRDFLALPAALAGAGIAGSIAEASSPLKDQAARAGVLFGAAAANAMFQEPAAREAILRNCAILTSTGEMKWDALRPGPAEFHFDGADFFVQFATRNGLAVHGHTLVWYQALPRWFDATVTRANGVDHLTQHIQTVVSRYRSKIRFWDVVNEIIDPRSRRAGLLRESAWLRLIGPDYIEQAFHTARAADPHATLVWNEDELESDNDYSRAKRRAVLNLLRDLRKRRVPVDALGLQAHLKPAFRKDNPDYLDFLRALKDTGVKLLVTELDVIDTQIPEPGRDESVASLYFDFVTSTSRILRPVSIQVWELSDARNWMDTFMTNWRRADGLPHRPAVLDENYRPKPAFQKLAEALREIS